MITLVIFSLVGCVCCECYECCVRQQNPNPSTIRASSHTRIAFRMATD